MATAAGTRDMSVSQGPGKLIFVIFFCSTNMVFLQVGDMHDDDEQPRHHIETEATAAAGVGARDASAPRTQAGRFYFIFIAGITL